MRTLRSAFVYRPGGLPDSHLYEVVEGKDIVMPAVSDMGARSVAAKKRSPEYVEVTLKLRMPVDILPTHDVGWIFDATDVLVVMAFKQGTIDFASIDSAEVAS